MRKVLVITGQLVMLALLAAGPSSQPSDSLAGQSFQIQNVNQQRLLRPRDASNKNGTPLVLYPQESWKCMTWKVEKSGDGYRLMNYFTHKTLQPDSSAAAELTPVIQEPAAKDSPDTQQWKFVPLGDDLYRIENVKSGEALGADADGNVTMSKWANTPAQKWKLLPKPDPFTG